ncbi:hypothetical protein MHB44_02935 [Lysinibacillus sp. FSL H8-0500]|uniref:hypothetical protein n=1 Tax=Lysinibacillus sp. FSL H8-0500 TaxID=2921393 RepID=UPI003101A338
MKKSTILCSLGLVSILGLSTTVNAFSTNEQTNSKIEINGINNVSVEEIKHKMLNSIDNYETVSGTYHTYLKPLGIDTLSNFEIDESRNPGSYIEEIDNKTGYSIVRQSDGKQFAEINHKAKEYMVATVVNQSKEFDTSKPRAFKNTNDQMEYIYRPDPAVAYNDVTFPQVYAFWLEDNITSITPDTHLNRDVNVIKGKLSKDLSEKRKSKSFEMWVDNKTGVLLKLIDRNSEGEVINKIEVTSIEFDINPNNSKLSEFNLTDIPNEYKNLSLENRK